MTTEEEETSVRILNLSRNWANSLNRFFAEVKDVMSLDIFQIKK